MNHLFGIALAFVAFGVFGRGILKRSKGKSFNPLPAFLLMIGAAVYHLFGDYSVVDKLSKLLVDFGVGMTGASFLLLANKSRARLLLVPGLLALVMGGGIWGLTQGFRWMASESDVTLLLELGPDDLINEVEPILEEFHADHKRAFENVDLSENEDLAQYYLVSVPAQHADALSQALRMDRENVDHLEVNHPVELIRPETSHSEINREGRFLANDPYLGNQWWAAPLEYNAVYELLKDRKPSKKAKVAIVDTGVDQGHEDLSPVYKKSGTKGDQDKHSHGTHCAGLAGAATNNGIGIGSLNYDGAYITISGFPALDSYGRGTDYTVSKAIIDAAESGADVISMSLGGYSPVPPKSQVDAIKYARKLGAIVIVAAGNSNDNAKLYSPANISGVITVAAVDEKLNKAVFSNTNNQLKMPIAAPGVNCLSSIPGSEYKQYSGTSMATPVAAGLLGILKALNPDLTAEQAYQILHDTGKTVNDSKRIGNVIMPKAAIESVLK
ncbi:MAG: S8 family serine peptidase [Bacteroidota bacterium]